MLALLADIGSTFTKVLVVDLEKAEIAGAAQAPTTREQDITIGLSDALQAIRERMPLPDSQIACRMACSSAAGGLRMVAVGLIPELTVEAARRAAFGAGAKIVGTFCHQLTRDDVASIQEMQPDILLLTGGTDGGNERAILSNAQAIALSGIRVSVVVAGNRVVGRRVCDTLSREGLDVSPTENVMPEVDELNIEPAQRVIREVFLRRIVQAKGLAKAETSFSGVLMPTPGAVLKAASVLSVGVEEEEGLGDLVVADVGGATTDVHSLGSGDPTEPGVILKGLAEPFAKRTVEGDLGIRYNAPTILQAAGSKALCRVMGGDEPALESIVERLHQTVSRLPQSKQEAQVDIALARTAVEIAVRRHAGTIKHFYTPFGETLVQYGKNLTTARYVIGTGGIFAHSTDPQAILDGALFDPQNPTSLRPRCPEMLLDDHYILAAMGLLAEKYPVISVRMMKRYLRPLSTDTREGLAQPLAEAAALHERGTR